jgi:thiamine-phosphate pyrophosphorylase
MYMRRRHPLPQIWLMTDPRLGEHLLDAVRRLPFRSGVIFRHYDLGEKHRLALFQKVARICRQRGHMLLLAGDERHALRWHADGFHRRSASRGTLLHSAAVHNRTELAHAKRRRVDMILISPLFATNSHRGQRPLGRLAFNRLAAQANGTKVIALGGVTRQKARGLNPRLIHGWAAIDAFRKKSG